MKITQILLASAFLGGLALPQVSAQTTITTGNQALIAGYDFNNILTYTSGNRTGARYSDIWGDANTGNQTALPNAGGLYVNGSFGSDSMGAQTARTTTTADGIDRDILTRAGVGGGFDLGGLSGSDGAFDFSGTSIGGATANEFAFNVLTGPQGFSQFTISLFGRDAGTAPAANSTTINWSYSLDGGLTKVATGLSSTFGGVNYTNSTVDFFGTPALDSALANVSSVVFIGQLVESATAARLNIDNVGIYGVAGTVIPEPSTYAAILGALTVGFVSLRRRFKRSAV
jgi:hypothetical protein